MMAHLDVYYQMNTLRLSYLNVFGALPEVVPGNFQITYNKN